MDLTSTVLVVDDDLTTRQALEDLLTTEGYDVACASNGADALAKATYLTPDLILLDVMMPDMDGFTVCQRLRADPLLAEVPVIMVTSLADRASRLRGFEAGADDYVSKPVDTPKLLARVRTTTRLNRCRRLLLEQARRRQMEKALRESEERFQNLVENMPVVCFTFDRQGRILSWNRAAERVYGYTKDEAVGANAYDLIVTPTTKGDTDQVIQEVFAGRTIEGSEWQDRDKEGQIGWRMGNIFPLLSADGSVDRGVNLCVDITDRKQAEEALRRERDRAQMYLDVAGVIMLVLNELGEIVLINRRGYQILDYEEQTLIGRNWFDTCLPASIREEVKSAFEELMAGKGEEVEYFENPVLTSSGEERIVAWHNTVLRDEAGRIIGTLSSGEDTTERKQMEKALRRRTDYLEVLHEVEQGILAAQSPEAIARVALDRIRQLVPCQRAGIILFEPAPNEAIVLVVDTDVETRVPEGTCVRLDRFKSEIDLLRQGRVVILDNSQSREEVTAAMYAEGVRSLVAVPLIYQDELIGFLSLGMSSPDILTFEHLDVVRHVIDQLAIAIQQARLYEQIHRHAEELEQRVANRTRELSVLFKIAALANQALDMETTLTKSLEQVLKAVRSDAGAIHLLDQADTKLVGRTSDDQRSEGKVLRLVIQQGIPPDLVTEIESPSSNEDLGAWLVEHDEPLIVPDITLDPREAITLPIEPYAYAGMPLRASGQTLGVLSIFRRTDQPRINVEELTLLTSVADQLGIVVEGARLRKRAEQVVVLEERGRLARDLHDSITQLLYSVNLFATAGQDALASGNKEVLKYSLDQLENGARQALRELRLMLYELRPPMLEREGLVEALQQRLDAVEGRVGVTAQLLVCGEIKLPTQIEQELYYIALEALNNALKHAQATSVTISIDADKGQIELTVVDNGRGFDSTPKVPGGMGLSTMRERARALRGELTINSTPGDGTQVRVIVPFNSLDTWSPGGIL